MVSSVRPQRGSRVTSTTGARPWCTPLARMPVPMAAAIWRTRPGSKDAPQASGAGKIVAFQAAKPVRHSSCAIAGMPNLLAATIRRCSPARASIPAAGGTGRVPNTRVSWPMPSRNRSSTGGSSALSSCCMGASPTSPSSPSPEAPIHTLPSWASFSASVIRRQQVGDPLRDRPGRITPGLGHRLVPGRVPHRHGGLHVRAGPGARSTPARSARWTARPGSYATAGHRSGHPASAPRPGPSRPAAGARW